MKKLSAVLLIFLLIGVLVAMTDVRTASAETTITVYFNRAGTIRAMDSPGSGTATVYIFGEGFEEIPPWVSGAQYKIDYGPHITWLADLQVAPASIGSSPSGISIGFGYSIKRGTKFLIQSALIEWNSDCKAARNASYPVVIKHPHFPDTKPIVTRFPDHAPFPATGRRSQLCQFVELDILPGECPNGFPATAWQSHGDGRHKGDWIQVAILGSPTVNVRDIDKSSILLEGVAPLPWMQTAWFDVGKADGKNDCECTRPSHNDDDDDFNVPPRRKDGRKDLLVFFKKSALAAAIAPTAPEGGTKIALTLTAAYNDGLPFEATDCIVIQGRRGRDDDDDDDDDHGVGGGNATAGLGHPNPNPFNPVTRINYNVPSTQHVRIAVYDIAGRLVENLVNEVKAPGEYVVEWNAGNLPSGIYFYRMQTGNETIVRRATLLK
jgi:hypothetical protein